MQPHAQRYILGVMFDTLFDCEGHILHERFLGDGSKRNNCISRLANGKTARPWAGPFFAFRRTHLDTYFEADMEQDLPVLVDFFTSGRMTRQ